jgi:hypothetical protein
MRKAYGIAAAAMALTAAAVAAQDRAEHHHGVPLDAHPADHRGGGREEGGVVDVGRGPVEGQQVDHRRQPSRAPGGASGWSTVLLTASREGGGR